MIFKITLLAIAFFYQSCSNIRHEIVYYDNGKKKYDIQYKNDKIDGKTIYWDKNGNLINVVNYSNDKFHGEWIDYYKNGNMQHIINYRYGQKHGTEIWYYQSGNMKSQAIYESDIIISDLIRWDDNGRIIYE